MRPITRTLLLAFFATALAAPLLAEDANPVLTIKDHKFEPAELKVAADKAVTITVKNLDATPEEIDSRPLKIEKVIAGNSEGTVRLRALKPGRYEFVGEYHESTAKGAIVVE